VVDMSPGQMRLVVSGGQLSALHNENKHGQYTGGHDREDSDVWNISGNMGLRSAVLRMSAVFVLYFVAARKQNKYTADRSEQKESGNR